jgi:5-formyltetrahydrofolate cyclo-ligase
MKIQCADKDLIRSLLKQKRSALSQERRNEASCALFSSLPLRLKSFQSVLSFHSIDAEIDTALLNAELASEKKLFLPKVAKDTLLIYQVTDLGKLLPSYGKLLEPDPTQCAQINLDKIECVLVPGLGFDQHKHRIGYGKGHYDRLLAQLKTLPSPPKIIGLGFKEQLLDQILPQEAHDISLDEILYY